MTRLTLKYPGRQRACHLKRGAHAGLGGWKKLPGSAKCKSHITNGRFKTGGGDAVSSEDSEWGFCWEILAFWDVFAMKMVGVECFMEVIDCATFFRQYAGWS